MKEKTLKTPIEVQEMTCKEFLDKFLPSKTSRQYTQASMFFFEYIAWLNFDNWTTTKVKEVILLLQKEAPEEFLKYRGVGITRIATFIQAFERAGIHLGDIPKYKKWMKKNSKIHP